MLNCSCKSHRFCFCDLFNSHNTRIRSICINILVNKAKPHTFLLIWSYAVRYIVHSYTICLTTYNYEFRNTVYLIKRPVKAPLTINFTSMLWSFLYYQNRFVYALLFCRAKLVLTKWEIIEWLKWAQAFTSPWNCAMRNAGEREHETLYTGSF
jgi:hypothetical protein